MGSTREASEMTPLPKRGDPALEISRLRIDLGQEGGPAGHREEVERTVLHIRMFLSYRRRPLRCLFANLCPPCAAVSDCRSAEDEQAQSGSQEGSTGQQSSAQGSAHALQRVRAGSTPALLVSSCFVIVPALHGRPRRTAQARSHWAQGRDHWALRRTAHLTDVLLRNDVCLLALLNCT